MTVKLYRIIYVPVGQRAFGLTLVSSTRIPSFKFSSSKDSSDILKYHLKPYLSKIACFLTSKFLNSLKFSDLPSYL